MQAYAKPEEIHLSLPAQTAYARLARIGAASLATRLEYSVSSIDDLRIAIDEALILLLGHHERDGRLEVTYTIDDTALTVTATASFVDGDPAQLEETDIERFTKIAAGLVDAWSVDPEAPSFTVELHR